MDLVVSEIEVREKSLYKEWDSIDPMLVVNVIAEAQTIISSFLIEPYASMTVAELREQKVLYLYHQL